MKESLSMFGPIIMASTVMLILVFKLMFWFNGIKHPSYVNYPLKDVCLASVYVYERGKGYSGYTEFKFALRDGKWKYLTHKTGIFELIIAAFAVIMVAVKAFADNGFTMKAVVLILMMIVILVFCMVITDLFRVGTARAILMKDLRNRANA